VFELAEELGAASERARAGKMLPTEVRGAVFSITSLGGIGGTGFTPIVNAPEVGILSVSRSSTRPVWDGKAFAPRLVLPFGLTYDHRVVDGATAVRFTTYLARLLGDVRRLLL
jgi:pyruvate dehydrogenase E2 component (dihydrolipoamide acetyltransferase)